MDLAYLDAASGSLIVQAIVAGAAGADDAVAVEGADAAVVLEPAVVVGQLLGGEGLAEGHRHDGAELVALVGRDRPDVDVHGSVVLETSSAHTWFSRDIVLCLTVTPRSRAHGTPRPCSSRTGMRPLGKENERDGPGLP